MLKPVTIGYLTIGVGRSKTCSWHKLNSYFKIMFFSVISSTLQFLFQPPSDIEIPLVVTPYRCKELFYCLSVYLRFCIQKVFLVITPDNIDA